MNAANKSTDSAGATDQRIAGALECIEALKALTHSAENLPAEADDADSFRGIQRANAERLVSLFGPLTPRQEGAFRALAEYIHYSITTGEPNLEKWTPVFSEAPEVAA